MTTVKKKGHFLKNILTGLSVNVPILGTFYLVMAAVTSVDKMLLGEKAASTVANAHGIIGGILPDAVNPAHYIPFLYKFPGVGLVVLTLYLYVMGVFFNTWLGAKIHSLVNTIMGKFPILSTAYEFLKKLMEQVNAKKDKTPKKPVWVEYPCKGSWAPAFDLGESTISCEHDEDGNPIKLRGIYVPTSPNPTSGFVLNMRPELVREAEVLTDTHMEYILSCGISMPDNPVYKKKITSDVESTHEIIDSSDVEVDRTKPDVTAKQKSKK